MLVAQNEMGELILLDRTKSVTALKEAHHNHQYYCPQCYGCVRLKIGTIKIPHFAHLSKLHCESFSEPESAVHLEAKWQLYEWLKRNHTMVQLEKTYSNLNQRADVGVKIDNQEYAIEFQRSTISTEQFHQRTKGYYLNGIIPLWILSGDCLTTPVLDILKLTSFHQQFLRFSHLSQQFYLLTYNTSSKTFTMYEQFLPLSKTTFLFIQSHYSTETIHFPQFPLKCSSYSSSAIRKFILYRNKWCDERIQYGKGHRDPLLTAFYCHQLSIHTLPPWVGLPLRYAMVLKDPLPEWQSYIYLFIMSSERRENSFSINQLVATIQSQINKKLLAKRVGQKLMENDLLNLVEEYVQLLLKVNILSKKNDRFRINRSNPFLKVVHISQKQNCEVEFWKENMEIVLKHLNLVNE